MKRMFEFASENLRVTLLSVHTVCNRMASQRAVNGESEEKSITNRVADKRLKSLVEKCMQTILSFFRLFFLGALEAKEFFLVYISSTI